MNENEIPEPYAPTLEDERLAQSLANGVTLPALYEHQANWANSGNDREIAIAARAIVLSIAG